MGEIIKCTKHIKYLGGHLDSLLTLKDHIIAKSKAATINIIKIRKYLNQNTCQKTCHHPSAITLGLLQLSGIRISRF